ncbi:MAG: hypothetical protein B6242_03935 [Anaerolineaceae bacterium 4572_78]|nr:MAG: hypothetical protein B6242_03935 [Anaerolineaceae bacterium 4572_78]
MMIKEIIYNATKHLKQHGCDTPRLDAEVILTHVLKQNRAWLYIHSNDSIPEKACHQFQKYIHRRACREPVAYIIGTRAFFGLLFNVSSTVLIPRPETELLVETALQLIEQKKYTSIIDMGTGSGCIAISLAVNAQVKIIATDISSFALYMAKHNAICHQVMDKITFVQSDLLTGLTGNIDLLVSKKEVHSLWKLNHNKGSMC